MAIEAPRSAAGVVMAAFAGFAPSLPALLANVHFRWVLQLVLFLELRKGHPMGPVAEHSFPLDDDGHLIALPDGEVASIEGLVGLTTPLLHDLESALLQHIDAQLIPALLAISLMHCRNVRVQTVEPPLALSRKAARRGGRPLVRYQVLDIGPMRTVLDHEGGAPTRGLGHALHICRGHFKTFTNDAPLFGKQPGGVDRDVDARHPGDPHRVTEHGALRRSACRRVTRGVA